ncbi:MarR family winged helix-turn-helix transcriptional regulator [Leifsonia kafniensis]|uniref:MarR family winged helix-turn-helix transcriptional regulator n=1 Tax=Leifsonia kafniensis TaxID=475957 RepID=A0ABP7L0J7_9MICO
MPEPREPLKPLHYELMLLSRYHLRPPAASSALDRSGYVLLNRLELVDPMTLKELSQALRLDTSTVHRQLGALLRHEYVEYVPGAAGEVARRFAPTAAGRAALLDARASHEHELSAVVGDWPAEKQQQLMSLLRDFNEQVERLESAPWPRLAD